MGPIELLHLISAHQERPHLSEHFVYPIMKPELTPEQLLDLVESSARNPVRIARQAMRAPEVVVAQRQRLRKLSGVLAIATPALLLMVIVGSLVQTNSSLVERVWEVTALTVLLAGLAIAFVDSRLFFLKLLSVQETPSQMEEVQTLCERSGYAAAWMEAIASQGRGVSQFDLEVMWALADTEQKKTAGT